MPYINPTVRKDFDELIENIIDISEQFDEDDSDGIANYIITRLAVGIIKRNHKLRYRTIARLIGLLECTKLELYRRMAAIYEDGAIVKNGDIKEYKNGV